jgi:hypothetical protein
VGKVAINERTYKRVMECYGYRCANCYSRAVHLHHLLPKSSHNSYRDDVRNLCPLCSVCHTRVHSTKTLKIWSKFLHERMDVLRKTYE